MDECFRFLINVDQCLNMSMYDIFFYKLKNEKKFRLEQLQDGSEEAFLKAFQNIHGCLKKSPGQFQEFQIIVTMRRPLQTQQSSWEASLLCLLLQLRQGLLDAQIPMERGCLNLILLREAEENREPEQSSYLCSERLEQDCALLLPPLTKPEDRAVRSALEDFWKAQPADGLSGQQLSKALAEYFAELFADFQVMELLKLQEPNRDPKKNTWEMLRVVEYITSALENTAQKLSVRCLEHWNAVKDLELESRYSDMLFAYEQLLLFAHEQLERQPLPVAQKQPRTCEKPQGDVWEGDAFPTEAEQQPDALVALDAFLQAKHTTKTVRKAWEDTCSRMTRSLRKMEADLNDRTDELGHQYARRSEHRKKDALRRQESRFLADEQTEEELEKLEKAQAACLNTLQNPELSPSLAFENQKKAEAALERANGQILYDLECLKTGTKRNTVIVFAVAYFLTILHYAWLQPFCFNNHVSLPVVLLVGLFMAFAIGAACRLPDLYYLRAIKRCALRLKKELETDVSEYHGRAERLRRYINTLDQLDRTDKLIGIYRDSIEHTRSLERGCMWHKTRIKDHLIKLGAFRSLIDSRNGSSRACAIDPERCPTEALLTAHCVNDIEQCSLYWPQGR